MHSIMDKLQTELDSGKIMCIILTHSHHRFQVKEGLSIFLSSCQVLSMTGLRNRVPTHKQVSEYLASSYTTMAIVTKKNQNNTDNKKTRLSVFLTCNNFLTLHNSWIALISPLKSHSSISPHSNRKPFSIKRGFTTNQLPLRIEWWEVQERKRGVTGRPGRSYSLQMTSAVATAKGLCIDAATAACTIRNCH